jgi:Tfp pilus assembly PilM family ATPase
MTRALAIHWDHDSLRLAIAEVGEMVRVEHLALVPLPEGGELEAARTAVAEFVAKHGLAKADVSFAIGRGQIEYRAIELPAAPDDELPDMIRYQAKNRFSTSGEGQIVDFIRLSSGQVAPLRVLAAALSGADSGKIEKICDAARLRLRHVLPRPFAVAHLLRGSLSAAKFTLIVHRWEREVDLSIAYRHHILLTRTIRLPSEAADKMATLLLELRRTLAAAANQPGSGQVSRILVVGNAAADQALAQTLDTALQLPGEAVGVADLVAAPPAARSQLADGSFAAALGCLGLSHEPAEHLIDFGNPRRRPEPVKDPRRKIRIAALAGGAALLMLAIAATVLFARRAEVSRLQTELDELTAGSSQRDLLIGKTDVIDRWKKGDINWLDELYEISDRFPLPDEAIVERFSASVAAASDEATIGINGKITQPNVENDIVGELRERPYRITQGKSNPIPDDPLFHRSFDVRLGIGLSQRNPDKLLQLGPKPRTPAAIPAEDTPAPAPEAASN